MDNSTPTKLTILNGGDNLRTYNVQGCQGAITNGNSLTAKSITFTLNKGQTITSP